MSRSKRFARNLIERRLGLYVRRVGHVRGGDMSADLTRAGLEIRTAVDVGAHWGETAGYLLRTLPTLTRLVCVEPDDESRARLAESLAHTSVEVTVVGSALSEAPGEGSLQRFEKSVNNALTDNADYSLSTAVGVQPVKVETFDGLLEQLKLPGVDLLKIDTEGSDMAVLKGAVNALEAGLIKVIRVEASMTGRNSKHVPLTVYADFLTGYGYELFGVYDQTPEYDHGTYLRRADLVFVRVGQA